MPRHPVIEEDLRTILADPNIDWEAFRGARVLISGANGFLPAYMVEALLYANETTLGGSATVLALVRNKAKAEERFAAYSGRKDLVYLEQDVADPITLDGPVDYVIHAASNASPRFFFSDPVGTINANTRGTSNLLELARAKQSKGFLYFSTGEVNGDIFDRQPIAKESDYGIVDPLVIRNCYAVSKKTGEALCAAYAHQYGVPARIVRPSHTYGPGFSFGDGRAFTSFVAAVMEDRNIVLKSDGTACRSFIYLTDATRGYFTVLLKGENAQAYNVGNAYEISMRTLAETILTASGKQELTLAFDIDPTAKVSSAAMHGMLDIGKIRALGWQPAVKEAEGFARVIRYYAAR